MPTEAHTFKKYSFATLGWLGFLFFLAISIWGTQALDVGIFTEGKGPRKLLLTRLERSPHPKRPKDDDDESPTGGWATEPARAEQPRERRSRRIVRSFREGRTTHASKRSARVLEAGHLLARFFRPLRESERDRRGARVAKSSPGLVQTRQIAESLLRAKAGRQAWDVFSSST